jgi:hypothetical protein
MASRMSGKLLTVNQNEKSGNPLVSQCLEPPSRAGYALYTFLLCMYVVCVCDIWCCFKSPVLMVVVCSVQQVHHYREGEESVLTQGKGQARVSNYFLNKIKWKIKKQTATTKRERGGCKEYEYVLVLVLVLPSADGGWRVITGALRAGQEND